MKTLLALYLIATIVVAVGVVLVWAIDRGAKMIDDYLTREKNWRAIEMRSCQARHPSSQVVVFDWAKETDL